MLSIYSNVLLCGIPMKSIGFSQMFWHIRIEPIKNVDFATDLLTIFEQFNTVSTLSVLYQLTEININHSDNNMSTEYPKMKAFLNTTY